MQYIFNHKYCVVSLKYRLCLQYGLSNPPPGTTVYKGMVDALIKIAREEGFKGLYKGFVPGIWGVSHGAIQFMAYEELKNAYNVYKKQSVDTKLVRKFLSTRKQYLVHFSF